MTVGGGRMSHRRHRLVRGRPDRKGILQQLARDQDKDRDKTRQLKEAQKEPMFDTVEEAFAASRRKPCRHQQ